MPLKAPETSLEIYKNIYFTSCTEKTANAMLCAMLCYMEKTYFVVL